MPNFLMEHWSGKINAITEALQNKLKEANIPKLGTVDPAEVRAFVLRKLMKRIKADAERQLKCEPQFFRLSDRKVMYGITDQLFQGKEPNQFAGDFLEEIKKDSTEFLAHREFNQCWPMGEKVQNDNKQKVQNDNKLFCVNHSEVLPIGIDARKVSNEQLKTWFTNNGHSRVNLRFSGGSASPDVVREELADIVESSTSTTEADNRLKTLCQSLNVMAELPKAAPPHVKNVPMSWKDFTTAIDNRYNKKYKQESGMSYQTADDATWEEYPTTEGTKCHHVLSVIKPIVEGIPPESKENEKRKECLQRVIVLANATYDYAGVPRYTYNSKGNVLPADAAKDLQECLLNGVKVPLPERYHVSTDEKLTHGLMKNQTFQKDYYMNASTFFSVRVRNQKSKPTQQTGQGNRNSNRPEVQRAFCEALRQYRESLPADVKDDLGKFRENVMKNLTAIICNARDILARQNNVKNARKYRLKRARPENNQPMVQNDQNEILLNEVNEDENMEMPLLPFMDNFDTQSVIGSMSILNGNLHFDESDFLPAVTYNNEHSDGDKKEAEGNKDNRTLFKLEDEKLNKNLFTTKKRYTNKLNFTNLYDAENNTFTGFQQGNNENTEGNPFHSSM